MHTDSSSSSSHLLLLLDNNDISYFANVEGPKFTLKKRYGPNLKSPTHAKYQSVLIRHMLLFNHKCLVDNTKHQPKKKIVTKKLDRLQYLGRSKVARSLLVSKNAAIYLIA
jgi:hypothetical protein